MKIQRFFFLIFFAYNFFFSQKAIVSSGGSISNDFGKIDYTIGEPFFDEIRGANNSIKSGVQQVYIINNLGTIENYLSKKISAYPNPSKDFVNIKIDVFKEGFVLLLFNEEGLLIRRQELKNSTTTVDVSFLSTGCLLYTSSCV